MEEVRAAGWHLKPSMQTRMDEASWLSRSFSWASSSCLSASSGWTANPRSYSFSVRSVWSGFLFVWPATEGRRTAASVAVTRAGCDSTVRRDLGISAVKKDASITETGNGHIGPDVRPA